MADSRPSQSGSDNTNNETNFETVVSLLRRAESLLSSRLSGNNISGGAETNTGGSNPETVSSSERSDRSLANFRTLFARYNNTGGGSHRLSLLHRLDKQGQGRQQSERSLVLLLKKKHGLMISFV